MAMGRPKRKLTFGLFTFCCIVICSCFFSSHNSDLCCDELTAWRDYRVAIGSVTK